MYSIKPIPVTTGCLLALSSACHCVSACFGSSAVGGGWVGNLVHCWERLVGFIYTIRSVCIRRWGMKLCDAIAVVEPLLLSLLFYCQDKFSAAGFTVHFIVHNIRSSGA